MQGTAIFTLVATAAFTRANVMPSEIDLNAGTNDITCTPGEYMCVIHAKDWAGPDEIWTCSAQGDLILSAICGGRICCQDSGSGVKCMC